LVKWGNDDFKVCLANSEEGTLGIRFLALGVFVFTLVALLGTNTFADQKKLVKYVIKDDAIMKSLTGKVGNPENGRKLVINRKKGNCLACHKMPIYEQQFHGNVGPRLHGVGNRLTEGQIRLQIVNSKVLNENAIMPSFYVNSGFNRVLKKFQDKALLSAAEIEDLVAYTVSLK
jgi:sulfur-oxidizing protein SoxX